MAIKIRVYYWHAHTSKIKINHLLACPFLVQYAKRLEMTANLDFDACSRQLRTVLHSYTGLFTYFYTLTDVMTGCDTSL